jgi:two-component system, NtrC family, response regulator HupR/HoxA
MMMDENKLARKKDTWLNCRIASVRNKGIISDNPEFRGYFLELRWPDMSPNKVLFVDDESNVLSAIRRAVQDEKYMPFFAGSGSEALTIMENNEFCVIVTDMRMPVMDGLTLLKIVKEKYPKTVRVVLSGFTQLSQMLVTINQGEIFKFITKPWTTNDELLPIIEQAIDYYNLQSERDTLTDNLAMKNIAYQNIFRAMEEKKSQEKSELRHLYKISVLLFSLWKKNIAIVADKSVDQQIRQDEIIHIAEVIYLTYLNQLPTVINSRTSSKLIDEIITSCDKRLVINNISKDELKTKGNHNYLVMMFKILLHILPEKHEKIKCDLVQGKQSEGMLQLIFDIDLKAQIFDSHDENQLKIACTLLNKIGVFYNMGVSLEYVEEKINYIRVSWGISEG